MLLFAICHILHDNLQFAVCVGLVVDSFIQFHLKVVASSIHMAIFVGQ